MKTVYNIFLEIPIDRLETVIFRLILTANGFEKEETGEGLNIASYDEAQKIFKACQKQTDRNQFIIKKFQFCLIEQDIN